MAKLTNKIRIQLAEIESFLREGDIQAALPALLEFTGVNPNVREGWLLLHSVAEVIDEPRLMWKVCRELVRLDPTDLQALYDLTIASSSTGLTFSTKVHSDRYLQKADKESVLFAEVQKLRAECEKGILTLLQDGVFPPQYLHTDLALYEEAKTFSEINDWESAFHLTVKIANKLPDVWQVWELLCSAYLNLGEFDKASNALQTLFKIAPNHPQGLSNQVQLLVKLG